MGDDFVEAKVKAETGATGEHPKVHGTSIVKEGGGGGPGSVAPTDTGTDTPTGTDTGTETGTATDTGTDTTTGTDTDTETGTTTGTTTDTTGTDTDTGTGTDTKGPGTDTDTGTPTGRADGTPTDTTPVAETSSTSTDDGSDPPPVLPPLNYVTSPNNPPEHVIVVDGDGQILGTAHWDPEAGAYQQDNEETTIIEEESGVSLPMYSAPQLAICGSDSDGERPPFSTPSGDTLDEIVDRNRPAESPWQFRKVDATRQSTDCWHTDVLYWLDPPLRTGSFGIMISANQIAKDGSKVSAVVLADLTQRAFDFAMAVVAEGILTGTIPAVDALVAQSFKFFMWDYFRLWGRNEGLTIRLC